MRPGIFIHSSIVVLVLSACAEQQPDISRQSKPAKPVAYLPGSSLFSIISPDGADITQPWNAKDSNLINTVRSRALGGVSADAVTSSVTACEGGGTTTTTVDNQGMPWFSEGDVFTTSFEDCIRGNTMTAGQRQFSVDVLVGQQFIDPDWSLTTTVSRDIVNTDLINNTVNSVKGFATTAVEVTNTTQYLQTLSGGFENERPNNGVQVIDTAQYLVTYQWDEAPGGSYSWDFDLKTTSTNPVFADTTTKTLETLSGPNNQAPETGKLQIVQAQDGGNRTTTITAIGGEMVLVEVDQDGDGVAESSNEQSWQEVVLDPFLYQFF